MWHFGFPDPFLASQSREIRITAVQACLSPHFLFLRLPDQRSGLKKYVLIGLQACELCWSCLPQRQLWRSSGIMFLMRPADSLLTAVPVQEGLYEI